MDQLIPVLMIVGMVAFVLIRQINKVASRTQGSVSLSNDTFERYAKFSSIIQEHVRTIKNSLDSTKEEKEETPFKLLEGKEEASALEILSDFIRKLVFFETMMAKQKRAEEIEAALFEVLSGLETFIKEYCEDGEALSEMLRDTLLEAYEGLE